MRKNVLNVVNNNQIADNSKSWISLTGYRALLLLRNLIISPKSKEEIVALFSSDPITSKSVSIDTLRLTLNTLKMAGCTIERPSKKNNFRYTLINHPFKLNLSSEDIDVLISSCEKSAEFNSREKILILNNFYKKIFNISIDENLKIQAKESLALNFVKKDILLTLSKPNIKRKKINILYKSRENGFETLEIIPLEIVYENKKLYLKCFICKYNNTGILNIEKILKINSIEMHKTYDFKDTFDVVFEVFDKEFKLKNNEIEIEQTLNSKIIKAEVKNEFLFIQRILELGDNAKIISPVDFKKKLIRQISNIRELYL